MLGSILQGQTLKERVLKEVFQQIYAHGPVSKAELVEKTNLKQTTLSRMIAELLHHGLIRESGYGRSSGGRPPVLYRFDPECHVLIGVDISRTSTKVQLFDLSFQPLAQSAFVMDVKHTPQKTVQQIQRLIEQLVAEQKLSIGKLLGIGIGSVGPIDRENGVILSPEWFPAPGWKQVPLIQMLAESFAVPIVLENGANTAAMAEYEQKGRSSTNLLYCISGEGVRGGFISEGKLLQSRTGEASAYGHMVIDMNGRSCSCGKKGCLSAYVTLQAVGEEVKSLKRRKETEDGAAKADQIDHRDKKACLSATDLLALVHNEDEETHQAVMNSATYYGIGLANMIHLLHPDEVILSGPLIYANESYYKKVVQSARQHLYPQGKEQVTFSKGVLQENAVAVGAAMLVLNTLLER